MACWPARKGWGFEMEGIGQQFRDVFHRKLGEVEAGLQLKEAALARDMAGWTMALTNLLSDCCNELAWSVGAKWNSCALLPEQRKEYFTLDVVAFEQGRRGWQFPVATMELENMASKRKVAYCMWKLLAVNSGFRCLFCYRERADQRNELLDYLRTEVIEALRVDERERIQGATYLCVGTRDDAPYFPNGFFRWWSLNLNTNRFEVL